MKSMTIDKETLDDLTGIIEDTVEYFCDKYQASGELAWVCVSALAEAKIAELKGELAPSVTSV